MSSARFTKIDAGLPSLDTTELVFSVNKPVLLTGFSILGGTCTTSEYQYNVSLMKVRLLYSVHTPHSQRIQHQALHHGVHLLSKSLSLSPGHPFPNKTGNISSVYTIQQTNLHQ